MSEFGLHRKLIGTVISNKMQKTVVVEVKRRVLHEKYKKYIGKRVRFKAHDENNECGIGDRVVIVETRRISADKYWKVDKIIEKAKGVIEIVNPVV